MEVRMGGGGYSVVDKIERFKIECAEKARVDRLMYHARQGTLTDGDGLDEDGLSRLRGWAENMARSGVSYSELVHNAPAMIDWIKRSAPKPQTPNAADFKGAAMNYATPTMTASGTINVTLSDSVARALPVEDDLSRVVRQLEAIGDLIERLETEKIEREYRIATLTRITAIIVAVSAFGAVCVREAWAHWGAM